MADEPEADGNMRGEGAGSDVHGRAQPSTALWRSLLPWNALRDARDERDRARSERDAARRALKASLSERDAAFAALATARAERDVNRDALEREQTDREHSRTERDARVLQSSDEVMNHLREIHALDRAMNRRLQSLHRELMTDIQALQQLMSRYAPEARLPPVAGWALSPAGLLALTDIIEKRGARSVVECGSGTSTLWIAYALKRLGRGHLIALDHLSEYASKTRAVVAAHGLSDFVEVRDAPLVPRDTVRGEFSWYSFDAADLRQPVDVLLIDGPPGTTGKHARYPALSVFVDHLAPGAIIVADDVDRRDEREMLEFWLREEPRLRRQESPGAGVEVLEFSG